jgi:hypothetical protein
MVGRDYPPFDTQSLVQKLRIRAEIRKNAVGRRSVQNGESDRLASLLEEAANRIEELESNASE